MWRHHHLILLMACLAESSPSCPGDLACPVCDLKEDTLTLRCEDHAEGLKEFLESLGGKVHRVIWTGSGLTDIPELLCVLPRIQHLDLSKNRISLIGRGSFSCLRALITLNLQHNCLREMHAGVLDGLTSLRHIDVSHNRIYSIHNACFTPPPQLRHVNLANNSLTFTDSWFFKMAYLAQSSLDDPILVNLSFNSISEIRNTVGFTLNDLPIFRRVSIGIDLRRNRLRHLADCNVYKLYDGSPWNIMRVWDCGFFFQYNPFDCDCDMFYFIKLVKWIIPFFKNFSDLSFLQVTCASPPEAKGVLIYKLQEKFFRCFVRDESCPAGCLCVHRPGNVTMQVDCHNYRETTLPQRVPHEKRIQLYFPKSRIRTLESRYFFANVSYLNLQDSCLTSLSSNALQTLTSLEYLDLQNNQISTLPKRVFEGLPNLKSLFLSGNPFVCDCHLAWVRHWIRSDLDLVRDADGLTCHNERLIGRRMTSLESGEFSCGARDNFVLIIWSVFGNIMFVALLLVVTSITHCYWRNIQFRVFKTLGRKVSFGRLKRKQNIKKHIGLLFHSDDHNELTNHILPILQDFLVFNPLVLEDWRAASQSELDLQDQINRESLIILALISPSFIRDPLTVFHFKETFDVLMRHEDHFILPILLSPKRDLLAFKDSDRDLECFIRLDLLSPLIFSEEAEFKERLKEAILAYMEEYDGPHILDIEELDE